MRRVAVLLLIAFPALAQASADNIVAFARLYAVVRFFHPAEADWNAVAVAGVQAVENADTPEELTVALQRIFPSVWSASGGDHRTGWLHYGGHLDAPSKLLTSELVDERSVATGTLVQPIDATPLRGRTIAFGAYARTTAHAELAVRTYRADGSALETVTIPLRGETWREYSGSIVIGADVSRIVIGAIVHGSGALWLDDVRLAGVSNASFDEGTTGLQPPGWTFPYESLKRGYKLALTDGAACHRGKCALIESSPLTDLQQAADLAPLRLDLGRGIVVNVPLRVAKPAVLHVDADAKRDSRAARLGALVAAWAIASQLSPSLGRTPEEWTSLLRELVPRAAAAESRAAFRDVARELLPDLHDSLASFSDASQPPLKLLPLTWAWADDRIVVTRSLIDAVRPGDAIVALNGVAAADALHAQERITSGGTPASLRSRALERMTAGTGRITLTIERGGAMHDVETEYTIDTGAGVAPKHAVVEEVAPGVVYADLGRLDDDSLAPHLATLAAAKAVVFDLRGGTDVSTRIISYLATRTTRSPLFELPVFSRPDRAGVEWLETFWTVDPLQPHIAARCAVLADERTQGYAETLLAMFARGPLATIVGSASAGSNGTFNRAALPAGFTFQFTASRVADDDGRPQNGRGIAPAIAVQPTRAGIAAGRDEVLDRAVAAITTR